MLSKHILPLATLIPRFKGQTKQKAKTQVLAYILYIILA